MKKNRDPQETEKNDTPVDQNKATPKQKAKKVSRTNRS